MRRVAILAASWRELAPARAALGSVQRGRRGSFERETGLAGGVEVHLVKTGLGPDSAFAAADALLAEVAVDAVVSTGYAGALGPAGAGEVILGTEVLNWTKEHAQARFCADPALMAIAREAVGPARVAWSQGVVVTVENVVWRAAEKHTLGKVSGAIAVDMEGAAIAQAAAAGSVPFLSVRAVSDRADEDLPMDFNCWFTPWGRVRGIAQVLACPLILRSVLQLRRQAEQGSRALAQFFRAFFVVLDAGHLPADVLALATVGKR
jgi:adenosylhomocysteine nucleosidase